MAKAELRITHRTAYGSGLSGIFKLILDSDVERGVILEITQYKRLNTRRTAVTRLLKKAQDYRRVLEACGIDTTVHHFNYDEFFYQDDPTNPINA